MLKLWLLLIAMVITSCARFAGTCKPQVLTQRGACASMIAPANSSHMPQPFLWLGRLQGAEAPLTWLDHLAQSRSVVRLANSVPTSKAAVVNIWL